MKMETIDLSNLPKYWYKLAQKETEEQKETFKSNDPLVDGSEMTINPEIKHRRKRIVSQQNYKTKRPHIAEFINACKFLAGETSKVFPLSMQHQNILSLVRNDKEIPEHYQSVINNNIDLVQKAAKLKPKEIKEKYCIVPIKEKETKQMQRKVNPKNVRTSEQAGNKFKEWLLNNLSNIPFEEKQEDMRYASIVSYYRNHNGEIADYMPRHSKAILDEYASKLKEFITSKNRLLKIEAPINTQTVKISETQSAISAPKMQYHAIAPVESPKPSFVTTNSVSTELTDIKANDALSMIIMLAKKAGASELIIKL